jgi:hypothetical protein
MNERHTRRAFLRRTAGIASAAAALRAVEGLPADATGELPRIKLGTLEVSRLVLGSNPFFGFSHGNPQATADEMRAWYTPERIMAVLDQAAEHGVTAVWAPCYENWVELWKDYRRKGGKLAHWIGQPDRLPMERDIDIAAENGAAAVFIQGGRTDEQVRAGKWDVVTAWLERIKRHGLPAGIASHETTTHLEAEKRGIPADFFHQCLYRPGNYVPEGAEETLDAIEKLTKPVVVFKALAAGRVSPKDALPPLFRRLKAKDGVCVGVFPRQRDEIGENASLSRRLAAAGRGWNGGCGYAANGWA